MPWTDENLDDDAFTDKVREYDEISRLDPQKTTLLLEVKHLTPKT